MKGPWTLCVTSGVLRGNAEGRQCSSRGLERPRVPERSADAEGLRPAQRIVAPRLGGFLVFRAGSHLDRPSSIELRRFGGLPDR